MKQTKKKLDFLPVTIQHGVLSFLSIKSFKTLPRRDSSISKRFLANGTSSWSKQTAIQAPRSWKEMAGGGNTLVKVVSMCSLGVETALQEWLNVKAKQLGSFFSCSLIFIIQLHLPRNNQSHKAIILWLLQLLRRRDLIIQYLRIQESYCAILTKLMLLPPSGVCSNVTFSKKLHQNTLKLSAPNSSYLFSLLSFLFIYNIVYFTYLSCLFSPVDSTRVGIFA